MPKSSLESSQSSQASDSSRCQFAYADGRRCQAPLPHAQLDRFAIEVVTGRCLSAQACRVLVGYGRMAAYGCFVAAAFLVAALRLFDFAARLRAVFNFRFRISFFAADLLILGIALLSSWCEAQGLSFNYLKFLSLRTAGENP